MDLRRRQLLLALLHFNKMNMEMFMAIGILASEVNLRCFKTRLIVHDDPMRYNMRFRLYSQIDRNFRLFVDDDTACLINLRMDRNCFHELCLKLHIEAGLTDGKYVSVKEQVGIFLSIIAHNKKSRIIHFDFIRSSETVSRYFHAVLRAVLSLHKDLLVKQTPVTPDNAPEKWQYFQGCLGALDGTHIRVRVPRARQLPYRGRKSVVTLNVLAACDWNMNFTYVLSGWEGSAADSRVLRNALARPNGLRIPDGQYYLCDNGYTHGAGFITPYTQTRYHLKMWGHGMEAPQNKYEFYNMVHSKARNVIERCFGLLKTRWASLDEQSKYYVQTQNKVIMACCLLQNFIRRTMSRDPLEDEPLPNNNDEPMEDEQPGDYVQVIRPTPEWDNFRDELAQVLYDDWLERRGAPA